MRDQSVANARYYKEHRKLRRVKERQAATLAHLRELRLRPCMECGLRLKPHQMDFDHRDPKRKSFRLTSGAAMLASKPRLEEEIAKCDVVCAVCHRLRTRARSMSAPPRPSTGTSAYLDRKRKAWRANARVLDRLKDVPCVDRQRSYPSAAMDFDHRDPREKRDTVA